MRSESNNTTEIEDNPPGMPNPFQLVNERTPEKVKPTGTAATSANGSRKRLPFSSPGRPRHNLPAVYERIYGRAPNTSHHAEADVVTLFLAAVATPGAFLAHVDSRAVPFAQVKKCW